jgi:hypothetical protein
MQILAPLPVMQSGQTRFLESDLADTIWEQLCDSFMPGEPFTANEAAYELGCLAHYSRFTKGNYVRTVIRAIIADYAHRPDDYANIEPIRELTQRRGKEKLYVL